MPSNSEMLPADLQDRLTVLFIEAVESVAAECAVPDDALDCSAAEVALALEEARKDLEIMAFRRGASGSAESFSGLSVGKLAGVLLFRLSRYRIINIIEDALQGCDLKVRRKAFKIQELAALRFVCEHILLIRPKRWNPELLYVLSRRHINQEMLGVSFDILLETCEHFKTKEPLSSPPFDRLYPRN